MINPILKNEEAPSLDELCGRYDIPDKSKASNMIVTIKRRFRNMLRRYVRGAAADEEADDEIQELIQILSRGRTS